jgi:PhzF family phenazine biosynthesis protein
MSPGFESKIFQIDAFTNQVFNGNPAAICPLDTWLTDQTMQSIAFENNLSETAFFVKNNYYFELRWFTPILSADEPIKKPCDLGISDRC